MVDVEVFDAVPMALEAQWADGQLVHNRAFRAQFPKLCDRSDQPSVEYLATNSTTEPITGTSRLDLFELLSHNARQQSSWQPDIVVPTCLVGRPGDESNSEPRYFQVRETQLEGGGKIWLFEDQTPHWLAELELRSSFETANALMHMQDPLLPGVAYCDAEMDRICGDFVFARKVLQGDRESLLWVVGDCAGHGIDAAVLRVLLVTRLEELIERFVKRSRKDLVAKDKLDEDEINPFDVSDKARNPARTLLEMLHAKMREVPARAGSQLGQGPHYFGFDGAVVYLERKRKGKRIRAWIALSNFSVVLYRPGAKPKRQVISITHRSNGGEEPLYYKTIGGVSDISPKVELIRLRGHDLLFSGTDGVDKILQLGKGRLPPPVHANQNLTGLIEALVGGAQGVQELAERAWQLLEERRAGAARIDDTLVCVLSAGQVMDAD